MSVATASTSTETIKEEFFASIIRGELSDLRIAQEIIDDGLDINTRDELGRSCLHYCAEHNHIDFFKILYNMGAYLAVRDKHGDTPLHLAVSFNRIEVARFLIHNIQTQGLNVRANDGFTPLHCACYSGREEIAKMLIEAGARVDIPDDGGNIPEYFARLKKHKRIIKLFRRS